MPIALGLIVMALVVGVVLMRANEVFFVSVRDGRALLVRGRCPTPLLQEFRDVVERAGVPRASIKGVREGGQPRLRVSGADEFTAQRLRNVFGSSRWGKLNHLRAAAPSRADRNLGQLLGFAWLAWLLSRDR